MGRKKKKSSQGNSQDPSDDGSCQNVRRSSRGNAATRDAQSRRETKSIDYQNNDFLTDNLQRSRYAGLPNGGMTCYMNSVLQQLFHTPGVLQGILKAFPGSTRWNILQQTKQVFKSLEERRLPHMEGFWRTFKLWGEPIKTGEQQDAYEFFVDLISQLDEILEESNQSPVFKPRFQGMYTDVKDCQGCPHRFESHEPFLAVSLTVKPEKTLQEALHQFVQGVRLQGDNAYLCETCGIKRDATKTMCIKTLPPVLVIHLKRIKMDWQTGRASKFNDYFKFPLLLDMEPYTLNGMENSPRDSQQSCQKGVKRGASSLNQDDTLYHLVGVVVHTGQAYSGHYYSLIMDRCSQGHGKWYKCNDRTVSEYNMTDERLEDECFGGSYKTGWRNYQTYSNYAGISSPTLKPNSAYMLFYEKVDIAGEDSFTEPSAHAETQAAKRMNSSSAASVSDHTQMESMPGSSGSKHMKATVDDQIKSPPSDDLESNQHHMDSNEGLAAKAPIIDQHRSADPYATGTTKTKPLESMGGIKSMDKLTTQEQDKSKSSCDGNSKDSSTQQHQIAGTATAPPPKSKSSAANSTGAIWKDKKPSKDVKRKEETTESSSHGGSTSYTAEQKRSQSYSATDKHKSLYHKSSSMMSAKREETSKPPDSQHHQMHTNYSMSVLEQTRKASAAYGGKDETGTSIVSLPRSNLQTSSQSATTQHTPTPPYNVRSKTFAKLDEENTMVSESNEHTKRSADSNHKSKHRAGSTTSKKQGSKHQYSSTILLTLKHESKGSEGSDKVESGRDQPDCSRGKQKDYSQSKELRNRSSGPQSENMSSSLQVQIKYPPSEDKAYPGRAHQIRRNQESYVHGTPVDLPVAVQEALCADNKQLNRWKNTFRHSFDFLETLRSHEIVPKYTGWFERNYQKVLLSMENAIKLLPQNFAVARTSSGGDILDTWLTYIQNLLKYSEDASKGAVKFLGDQDNYQYILYYLVEHHSSHIRKLYSQIVLSILQSYIRHKTYALGCSHMNKALDQILSLLEKQVPCHSANSAEYFDMLKQYLLGSGKSFDCIEQMLRKKTFHGLMTFLIGPPEEVETASKLQWMPDEAKHVTPIIHIMLAKMIASCDLSTLRQPDMQRTRYPYKKQPPLKMPDDMKEILGGTQCFSYIKEAISAACVYPDTKADILDMLLNCCYCNHDLSVLAIETIFVNIKACPDSQMEHAHHSLLEVLLLGDTLQGSRLDMAVKELNKLMSKFQYSDRTKFHSLLDFGSRLIDQSPQLKHRLSNWKEMIKSLKSSQYIRDDDLTQAMAMLTISDHTEFVSENTTNNSSSARGHHSQRNQSKPSFYSAYT